MQSVQLGNTTLRLLVKHFPFHGLLGALGKGEKEKKRKTEGGERQRRKLKTEFEA